MKHNLNDKLMNESLTYNDLIQNEVNMQPKFGSIDTNIMHKNKLVEINPYKQRNYFLGKSQLKHNIITNQTAATFGVSLFWHYSERLSQMIKVEDYSGS